MGNSGLEEDHLFHLKIAECSGNPVLRSLIGLITPDIIAMSRKDEPDRRYQHTLKEHEKVLQGIVDRKPDAAAEAMLQHIEMARKRRSSQP